MADGHGPAPGVGGEVREGEVIDQGLIDGRDEAVVRIPTNLVAELAVSTGAGNRAIQGLLLGAIAGGLIGAAAYEPPDRGQRRNRQGDVELDFGPLGEAIVTGIVLGGVGLVLGWIQPKPEGWRSVPPRPSLYDPQESDLHRTHPAQR